MHLIKAVTILAAAVSAVDVRFYNSPCDGPYTTCTNINPDICCYAGLLYSGVGFHTIPTEWNIVG
jgi:hypothetical protein